MRSAINGFMERVMRDSTHKLLGKTKQLPARTKPMSSLTLKELQRLIGESLKGYIPKKMSYKQWLEEVQKRAGDKKVHIDQRKLDLTLVDDKGRILGHPWLSVAIDDHSRATLDANVHLEKFS